MNSTISDYASITLSKKKKLKEYAVDANSTNIFNNTLLALCKQLNLDSTDASVKEAIKNELVDQLSGINPAQLTSNVAQAIEEKGDIKAAVQAASDTTAKLSQESVKLADTIINFLNKTQADLNDQYISWVANASNAIKKQNVAFTVENLTNICKFLDSDWNSNEVEKTTSIIQPALKLITALGGAAPQLESINRLQTAAAPQTAQAQNSAQVQQLVATPTVG